LYNFVRKEKVEIRYKNDKVKKQLQIKNIERSFSTVIAKKYQESLERIDAIDNLHELKKTFRGMNIEKLKNRDFLWSLRLNKKYRLEFNTKDVEIHQIIEVFLVKIHSHKYD